MPDDLSKYDPRRFTRRVRRWVSYDGKEEGGKEIYDSHTWEDEDAPSWSDRILPQTPAGWFLALGLGTLLFAATVYLLRFFPGAYRDPTTLGYGVLLAAVPISYVYGRHKGVRRVADLDWSALYYGDDLEVRPGEVVGTLDGHTKFAPIKSLGYAGYNPTYLEARDVFPPSEVGQLKSKLHRIGKDGSGRCIDRLRKSTTAEVETETLGTILVTHLDELQIDEHGIQTDRYCSPPNLFDEEVGRRLTQELEEATQIQIPELESQIELLRGRLEDREEVESEIIEPTLKQSRDLVRFIAEIRDGRRQPSGGEEENGTEPDHGNVQDRIDNVEESNA